MTGLFVKFASQDNETDAYGNPLKTGIAELDAKGAIPPRVRKKLTRSPVLRRPHARAAIPAPASDDTSSSGRLNPGSFRRIHFCRFNLTGGP